PAAKVASEPSGSSSPQGQRRSSPPRATASHSSSGGRRTPSRLQNASASARETYVTGRSSPSPWKREFVTGKREIRKASSVTTRRGRSSSSGRNASAASRTMGDGPARPRTPPNDQ